MTRLEVAKVDLVDELKRMAKVLGRRRAGDAVLMYEHGQLRIRIGGAEIAVPARGQWVGEASVSAAWMRTFAKVPPAQDPVVFEVQGSRLRIGGSTIPCVWRVPGAATIEIPLDPGLRELLLLGMTHSELELDKSGLSSAISDARRDLEKRIKAAARPLAPLGITITDITLLVTGKLKFAE